MPKRIYVGNLPFSASDDEIRAMLEGHGKVEAINIKPDAKNKSAMAAIVFEGEGPNTVVEALHGRKVGGRQIVVSEDRNIVINHEEQ